MRTRQSTLHDFTRGRSRIYQRGTKLTQCWRRHFFVTDFCNGEGRNLSANVFSDVAAQTLQHLQLRAKKVSTILLVFLHHLATCLSLPFLLNGPLKKLVSAFTANKIYMGKGRRAEPHPSIRHCSGDHKPKRLVCANWPFFNGYFSTWFCGTMVSICTRFACKGTLVFRM